MHVDSRLHGKVVLQANFLSISMIKTFLLLQRINEWLAVLAGGLLLLSVVVTLYDVIARQIGHSMGGTDELSGYAMAIATSWGMSYTLTSLSHVRIDLLRTRCQSLWRSVLDVIAMLALAGTAVVVAYRVWPVLAKSIENNSTANTTLETPLWIPQSLWMAGWLWFAISAVFMLVMVLKLFVSQQFDQIQQHAGIRDDT